jgi:hypothetical protein
MLASELSDVVRLQSILDCNRSGTRAIIDANWPSDSYGEIDCDDAPYRYSLELSSGASREQLQSLKDRGCECLSYGNAAKAGTGEGSRGVVIRF